MQNILSFKSQDMSRILKTFEVKVNKKGELILSTNLVKCGGCKKTLKEKDVGSILPSSPYKFYCDNPLCIAEHVRKTKFKNN